MSGFSDTRLFIFTLDNLFLPGYYASLPEQISLLAAGLNQGDIARYAEVVKVVCVW